jgi:hypothetical protein
VFDGLGLAICLGMRHLVALIAVASSLITGCVFGCGAYDGEGDRTFRRGNESMILCTNGGFAMTLDSGIVEGRYTNDGVSNIGTVGDTGARAFTLTINTDGTAEAPELGMLAWEEVTLDKTDLDHAHLQCEDLETRGWWTVAQ